MAALKLLKTAVKSLIASLTSDPFHGDKFKRAPINLFSHNRILQLLTLILLIIITYGCKKSPVEPEFEPQLIASINNITLVKGGSELVEVIAYDETGNVDDFTVSTGDAGTASVTTSGNTFTVTGVDYGETELTITGTSGKSTTVPVIVYNPQEMETEELVIAFSQTFEFRWSNSGYGALHEASCWHPITNDGFKPLGTLTFKGYDDPNGKYGIMVVKAKNGSNALAAPIDYDLVYQIQDGIWPVLDQFSSFWIPVPPPGYKALGIVTFESDNEDEKPGLDEVVCVREDLVVEGEAGDNIWKQIPIMPCFAYLYSWEIESPEAEPHENAYLATGTFVLAKGSNEPQKPTIHPVLNVLNVDLPLLAETPYIDYYPTLRSYNRPPVETFPIFERKILVPCTIIGDPFYEEDQMWRITNSPFYLLERQVYYVLVYNYYNKTSVVQHNSYIRKMGVNITESEEFWNETSISVSIEAGISIFGIGSKVSTTISRTLGYSTMTSISEFQEDEYQSGVDVPPGKAVAIWQQYNRFILKRHNGNTLEPVKTWEFGINSFVTDEYPD